jgi:hypothetical protein
MGVKADAARPPMAASPVEYGGRPKTNFRQKIVTLRRTASTPTGWVA